MVVNKIRVEESVVLAVGFDPDVGGDDKCCVGVKLVVFSGFSFALSKSSGAEGGSEGLTVGLVMESRVFISCAAPMFEGGGVRGVVP